MAQWNKTVQDYRTQDKSLFEVVMVADQNGNPLNTYGPSANIPIAAGNVEGYSHINKFGYRDTLASTYQAIWDGETAYSYAATPGVATVTSDEVGDTGNLIVVQGLDADYNLTSETIACGSTGSQVFSRIFRANCLTDCAGEVDISVDSTTLAIILEGAGQTLMAVYTVPAGKTAYLVKFQGSIDKSNGECKFRLMTRPFGDSFIVKGQYGTAAGSSITYDYPVPLMFEEKTDIEIRAVAGATLGAGAIFDLILVDNV